MAEDQGVIGDVVNAANDLEQAAMKAVNSVAGLGATEARRVLGVLVGAIDAASSLAKNVAGNVGGE